MSEEPEEAKEPGAFARALREATERTQWSLSALAEELAERGTPVTAATLSYWRTGRRRPGRQASADVVRGIEQVLDLESGSLLAHVTGPRARGRGTRFQPLGSSGSDRAAQLAAMFAAMGMPEGQGHTTVVVSDRVRLDANGARVQQESSQVVRVTKNGLDALYVGFIDDEAADGPVDIASLSTGRIGAYLVDRDMRIQVARIDLSAAYEQGDTFLLSTTLQFPHAAGPAHSHERWAAYAMRENSVSIEFHPDLVAEEVEAFDSASSVITPTSPRSVTVRRGIAQHIGLDVAPGVHGMRWRFPGETWDAGDDARGRLDAGVLEAWRAWQPPNGPPAQEVRGPGPWLP